MFLCINCSIWSHYGFGKHQFYFFILWLKIEINVFQFAVTMCFKVTLKGVKRTYQLFWHVCVMINSLSLFVGTNPCPWHRLHLFSNLKFILRVIERSHEFSFHHKPFPFTRPNGRDNGWFVFTFLRSMFGANVVRLV